MAVYLSPLLSLSDPVVEALILPELAHGYSLVDVFTGDQLNKHRSQILLWLWME